LKSYKKNCLGCASHLLELIDDYSKYLRITSDSKPFKKNGTLYICNSCGLVQKEVNKIFLKDIESIYKNYMPYEIANQNEQKSLNEKNNFTLRSDILITKILEYSEESSDRHSSKKILDIGCSYGNTLSSFNRYFESPELYGLDLDDKNLLTLKKIENFKKLYNDLSEIDSSFNFISMVHTFEHILDPLNYLYSLKKYLKKDGLLFIQVPDAENSPIDFLITDHVTHFTKNTLQSLAEKSGYELVFMSNNVVKKEISMIIKLNSKSNSTPHINNNVVECRNMIIKNFSWLNKLIKTSSMIKNTEENYGIYGTSNATVWLLESEDLNPSFFVDDDVNRQGKLFLNKPVISKSEIPINAKVILPFVNEIVENIIKTTPDKINNFVYIEN
jgi:2-polyprenyl-3-methyl-5-hydroxy-6-metoxy-1,4-benzoquinol methylase